MKKEATSIPYVPVVGFEKAVKVLQKSQVGDPIDKAALERRGVAGNTYYQVVNALKFLQLVDQNKRITDNLQLWVKDRSVRLKFVQTAYKPLLDKLKVPAKDNAAVKKAIKDIYKMADSVVLLATTFFTWAARQGGMNVLEGDRDGIPKRGRGAKPGVSRRGSHQPRRRVITVRSLGRRSAPPVILNVNLQISKDTKKEDIHRMLADLKEELKAF